MIPATWFAASFPDNSCMRGLYPISRKPSTMCATRCGVKDSPGNASLPVAQASACGFWSLQGRTPQAEACATGRLSFPEDITREKCGLYRFVFCVAEKFEVASGAFGIARLADPAAVPNQLMRK